MLTIGIKGKAVTTADDTNSAASMGSGLLPVFATPSMIALIEKAACESVAPELEEGSGTVGTLLNVKHLAATPLGMKVTAETELVEIDRRRLVFKVEAYDEKEKIGEGIHERFIINNDKFLSKCEAKKD